VNSEAGDPSFTRRLIESAAFAAARGSGTSPAAALNAMRLPAIALDQHGFVAHLAVEDPLAEGRLFRR
jgi:hypothetical protein